MKAEATSLEQTTRAKQRAAGLSVLSNIVLVLGKLVVGLMTGSVAVVSEAVHSAMDLLAAIIAFTAVTLSGRPPDQDHAHGHGKIEDLSGAVEALLIFGAVGYIGYEAISKLVTEVRVEQIHLGVIVMGISSVVNVGVSWYLQRVGRRTDSSALLADAAHLRTDVYTSMGVLVGLTLVHFTGVQIIDPLAALAVSLLISLEAWKITSHSVGELLDRSLPAEELKLVQGVIQRAGLRFHSLRSRKSGSTRKIDLHLDVSPKSTAEQVHELCDRVEREVQQALPGTQVLIHPEPHMELDRTAPAGRQVTRILERHRGIFEDFSDVHVNEDEGRIHVIFRLGLAPETSVAEVQRIVDHLDQHLQEHLPGAEIFIHPEPRENKEQGTRNKE